MAVKKSNEKISVEAMCEVTHSGGVERIRTFDKAWHRALDVTPATLTFVGFVRKEEKKN